MEIKNCLDALARLNLDVFAVDVTHPQTRHPGGLRPDPGHPLPGPHPQHQRHLPPGQDRGPLRRAPGWRWRPCSELNEAFPERFEVHFFLGLALANLGMTAEALEHFQKTLTLNPPAHEVPSIYVHLAVCQKDLENYPEAISALQQALSLEPNLMEAYQQMGFCHFKLGQYQDAANCFEKAIELDHGSAIDYANLGINLLRLGHRKEAAYVLKQALELDASLDFAARALAELARTDLSQGDRSCSILPPSL